MSTFIYWFLLLKHMALSCHYLLASKAFIKFIYSSHFSFPAVSIKAHFHSIILIWCMNFRWLPEVGRIQRWVFIRVVNVIFEKFRNENVYFNIPGVPKKCPLVSFAPFFLMDIFWTPCTSLVWLLTPHGTIGWLIDISFCHVRL